MTVELVTRRTLARRLNVSRQTAAKKLRTLEAAGFARFLCDVATGQRGRRERAYAIGRFVKS